MALTRFPLETDQPRVEVTLPPGRHVLELVVEDSAGLRSEPDTVTVTVREELPLPEIAGISPVSGVAGRSVRAAINGRHLQGATAVRFDGRGVTARILSSADPERLVVQVNVASNASPGARGFSVTTPAGTARSPEGVNFTVKAAEEPSTITGIEPSSGRAGTTVSAFINGTNLLGARSVAFSGTGVSAEISGRVSATRVPVRITISSRASTGPRSFYITTPSGRVMSPRNVTFTVRAAEVMRRITGIEPSFGRTGRTVNAVITGSGLDGASAVTFSGTGVTARISGRVSSTRVPVSITISRLAPSGARSFYVTTPAGRITSPRGVTFNVSGFIVVQPGELGVGAVEGIGPAYTERLTGAGISNAAALAEAEPSKVAGVLGISEERARVLINNARKKIEEGRG